MTYGVEKPPVRGEPPADSVDSFLPSSASSPRRVFTVSTRSYPFVMDHGKGSEVWSVDGNRFIDFNASTAVKVSGHCHHAVVRAIQK